MRIEVILTVFLLACGGEPQGGASKPLAADTAVQSVKPEPPPEPEYKHEAFPDAAAALRALLARKSPRVLGFGEFHQQEGTKEIRSALDRFARDLLPVFGPATSDLVVETWVASGSCGQKEKQVVEEVEQVTERPKETENETVRLLRLAKESGVRPHILRIECEDYDAIEDPDGGVDYLKLLELVGERLGERGQQIIDAQKAGKLETAPERKTIAIYGGAIHNDANPAEIWESVAFSQQMKKAGDYLEVDLYVPEFIATSNIVGQEPWYPLAERLASPDKAHLIHLAQDAYIILFRTNIKTPKLAVSPAKTSVKPTN